MANKAKAQGTGVEHFDAAAKVAEETSNDGAFATTKVAIPAKDGNGALSLQQRGAPKKD